MTTCLKGAVPVVVAAMLAGAVLGACGTAEEARGLEAYGEEVERLKARIAEDPGDAAALRDLGEIYLRAGHPTRAYETLKDAYARAPSDPELLFYLGLAAESVGKRKGARKVFGQFTEVPRRSPYHALMMGRYVWLARQQARADVRRRLAEERIEQRSVSRRAVAVLPLACSGGEEPEAWGRGFAELLTDDLARIRGVQPVDRVRVQTLLAELAPPRRVHADPSQAPQIGRVLGAGHLLGGSCAVDGDTVRLDLRLARTKEGAAESPRFDDRAGTLPELFQAQGALAAEVAAALGVAVTRREKQSVTAVPTQNPDAFLAYSRGLLAEDRGEFEAAAAHYRRAHRLAPEFGAPARRTTRAEGLVAASGPPQRVLRTTQRTTAHRTSETGADASVASHEE